MKRGLKTPLLARKGNKVCPVINLFTCFFVDHLNAHKINQRKFEIIFFGYEARYSVAMEGTITFDDVLDMLGGMGTFQWFLYVAYAVAAANYQLHW